MIREAVRAGVLGVVATVALLVAPSAGATAVDLTSVTESNRLVSASWTLPPDASAWTLEISVDPSFDLAGVRESAPLGATENSFISSQPLAGGTYHVRVVSTTTPDACVIGDPSCAYEFSNIRTVTIASQAATLQDVAHIDGLLAANWALPEGAESWFAEISASPDRDRFGFLTPTAPSPIDVGRAQTSFTAVVGLSPGTYHVHIVSTPTYDLCVIDDPGCVFEYSNIVPVAVPAQGRPALLPSSPAPPAVDRVLALGAVTASASQDVDKLGITLNAGEAVRVKLSGSVTGPGASKVYRFRTVNRSLAAGKARLRLKLASEAKKAVKRALRRKKNLKAKLMLVVTDAAGNSQTKKYGVRLRP